MLKKVIILPVLISLLQMPFLQNSYADSSKIFLRIEVISSKGIQKQWSLKCGPLGGSHPNKLKACSFLSTTKGKSALFLKDGENCTQIYGGSASATIKGRYEKKKIDLTIDRSDGCKIQSWDRLIQILRLT